MTREPVKLGDVLKQVSRKVVVLDDVEYPELGLRAHGNGTFHKPPVNGSETTKDLYSVEAGDLLLSVVFAWEGAAAVAGPADHGRFTSHRFPAFRCDPSLGVEEYMALWLVHGPGRQLLVANSPGGAGRNKTLNKTALLACTVRLPSVAEQRRIVDLLSTADRLVDALASETDACRSAAEQLAESLLTSSALPRRELSNALTETTPQRVADPSQYEGLSVRLYGEGVVPSGKRPNTTANGRPYYVRRPGEILVGRQNFHNGATGVVPPTPSEMVTSNAISAFEIRDGYDKDFVVALLQTPSIYRSVLPLISGTGQKETGVKLLMSLSVPLPGIEEQRMISATLLAASQRLNAVQEQALAVRFLRDQMLHDLLSGAHTIPESYDRFLAEVPA